MYGQNKSTEPAPLQLTPTEIPLWAQAWTAVANANDCKSSDTARNWADKMIIALRERTKT